MRRLIVGLIFLGVSLCMGEVSYKGDTFKLYGEFDDFTAAEFGRFIETVQPDETIHIRIDSPGGSVTSLARIVALLQEHKGTVITYNDGMAASCGFLLFLEGDVRYSSPYAIFMCHSVASGARGKPSEIQEQVDLLHALNKNAILRLESLGATEAKKWFGDKDIYFTYSQMLEMNLVQEVK